MTQTHVENAGSEMRTFEPYESEPTNVVCVRDPLGFIMRRIRPDDWRLWKYADDGGTWSATRLSWSVVVSNGEVTECSAPDGAE